MNRREVIAGLSGAAAWPLAAQAQQSAMPVVGFLGAGWADGYGRRMAAFRAGLAEAGFIEGRNVAIEIRWADGQYDRLPSMAADLVRRQVDVIAATGAIASALAAKTATTTIPIVFSIGNDPVEIGLVGSLSRPGGNLTGVTTLALELAPKRLELLREMVPTAGSMGVLVNPTNPNLAILSRDLQAASRILGVQIQVLHASTEPDLDAVFATLVQLRAGGLVIGPDTFFNGRSEQLSALALHYAVPTIYQYREFVAAGGLMSYGGSETDAYRLAGVYTGRILKGERPADLPVQRATKTEMFINLKTAKALGLTVPQSILLRADEVIE
jgi:putative tryptophan/tyrosine transport system substrate-binding protein